MHYFGPVYTLDNFNILNPNQTLSMQQWMRDNVILFTLGSILRDEQSVEKKMYKVIHPTEAIHFCVVGPKRSNRI